MFIGTIVQKQILHLGEKHLQLSVNGLYKSVNNLTCN